MSSIGKLKNKHSHETISEEALSAFLRVDPVKVSKREAAVKTKPKKKIAPNGKRPD